MTRSGKFGGMISAASILNPNKNTSALRYASFAVREAAKIGLQSLYSHPEKVLDRYKDFDIVKAMKDRKDSKILWVRARAIDADKVNTNGDSFSKKELLNNVDFKGEKIPAYKTFEGVPIYSNHQNDDVELAKGMVVYAEWDDEENCVYCTFFIDEEAYPDVARGVRQGYIHDVSMGTSVEVGECSECGNEATVESEWCTCLKKYKGKRHPSSGKLVYEKNRGLKFIELSVVGDGAFDTCEIQDLFEPEEIINFAESVNKKASEIQANIALASSFTPDDLDKRYAFEQCLRKVSSVTDTIIRVAQEAGNLVGGQVLGIESGSQNATVTNILQFLGIDPATGLNILDLLNLALNFLEVAVMNLFARKDNIDLAHVSKISKAMAELQTTMQDLIDDGITNAGPIAPGTPVAQGGAAQLPPGTPAPQIEAPTDVGTMVTPGAVGQQAPAGFGGGIGDQTQVMASALRKIANLKTAITKEVPQEDFNYSIGGKIMSFINEFKNNFDGSKMIYEALDSASGQKIVISADGSVKRYTRGQDKGYTIGLTEDEVNSINQGDIKTAANSALKRFVTASSDEEESTLQKVNNLEKTEPDEFVNARLQKYRTYENDGEEQETLEKRTRPLRKNDYTTTVEKGLGKPSWTSRKGTKNIMKEKLLETARRGVDDTVMEERLEKQRKSGGKPQVVIVEKVMCALAASAVKYGLHPREIIAAAEDLLRSGPDTAADTISLTDEVKDQNIPMPDLSNEPEMAVADGLSDQLDDTTTSGDLVGALQSALQHIQDAVSALQNAVDSAKTDEEVTPKIEDTTPTDDEEVGADMATKADAGLANPDQQDVQAAVSSMANTVDQFNIDTNDALNSLASVTQNELHRRIEMQKQASSSSARRRNFARIAYYGYNKKASKKDILNTIVGHLADYSVDYKLRSKNLAAAISQMPYLPDASRKLVAQALSEKKNIKTAGVQVRDTQLNEKNISLTVDDIGMDVSDANFQDALREKVVGILRNSGYNVDPSTFSMNEVIVSPDGNVDVRVFTRFERSYDANSEDAPEMNMAENNPQPIEQAGPPEIADIIETRSAKRQKLLNRYAQMLPGMGGAPEAGFPAGGAAAPGGAPGAPAADPFAPPADAGTQPGLSTFTEDPMTAPGAELGGGGGGGALEPIEVLPGVKKPWGTVCPQCQSFNVEVSGGEGKCNDCNAQLRYEFIVHVSPPDKGEDYKGNIDNKSYAAGETEMGVAEAPPMDLGAGGMAPEAPAGPEATPPAAMPEAPPMGAPAAPGAMAVSDKLMVRVSWITDPDVYLSANNKRFASQGTPLPVGMTCPSCGARDVDKTEDKSFCTQCKTLSLSRVDRMITEPDKLISTISWIA
jgi:hypothetical protein